MVISPRRLLAGLAAIGHDAATGAGRQRRSNCRRAASAAKLKGARRGLGCGRSGRGHCRCASCASRRRRRWRIAERLDEVSLLYKALERKASPRQLCAQLADRERPDAFALAAPRCLLGAGDVAGAALLRVRSFRPRFAGLVRGRAPGLLRLARALVIGPVTSLAARVAKAARKQPPHRLASLGERSRLQPSKEHC
jgi:hypothetical protein